MTFGIVDSAQTVSVLLDHAQRLYPVLCHFEGWNAPSEIEWDTVMEGWSESNPGREAWDALEAEMCRGMDMAAAAIAATGVDMSDISDTPMVFQRGDLIKFITKQFRKAILDRKFEEMFKAEGTDNSD